MKLPTGTQESKKGFGPGYNKAQFAGIEAIQSSPANGSIFYGYKFTFALLKEGDAGLEPTKFIVDFSATEKLDKPIPEADIEKETAAGNIKWNKGNKAELLEALGLEDTDEIEPTGAFLTPIQVWLVNKKDNKGIDRLRMSFNPKGKAIIAGDVDGATVVSEPNNADDF